jgi:hypothetical protein
MDQVKFARAQKHLDEIAEIVDQNITSAESQKLRDVLSAFGNTLGHGYFVELDVVVRVFDEKRDRTLPLLSTGLSTTAGAEPYRTWGDSTPQRYVADGEIQVVPHDRCPRCWEVWDFKFEHPQCEYCGATLGQDVKILLDNDTCPHCEKGQVTATLPTCQQCGFSFDPDTVLWG